MVLKELIEEAGFMQKEVASKSNISESMMSKFAQYKCLPVPSDLKNICDTLGCKPLDIYSKNEIDLLSVLKQRRKSEELDFYRFTVTLEKSAHELLNPTALKQFGYYGLYDLVERRILNYLRNKKAKLVCRDSSSAEEKFC